MVQRLSIPQHGAYLMESPGSQSEHETNQQLSDPGADAPAESVLPPTPAGQSASLSSPPDDAPRFSSASYPPPPSSPPTSALGGAVSKDEKLWGTFMHLSAPILGIAGSLTGVPVLGVLGPLVLWLIKRHESRFLDDQGKEALNFNITVSLAMLVCIPLFLILIGIPLMILIGLGALVLMIIASIKANNGEWYRYPMTLRLVK